MPTTLRLCPTGSECTGGLYRAVERRLQALKYYFRRRKEMLLSAGPPEPNYAIHSVRDSPAIRRCRASRWLLCAPVGSFVLLRYPIDARLLFCRRV